VESLYEQGRPLHHLPSASEVEFDSEGSSIFVVSYQAYMQMDAQEIQNVFRDRHILVHGVPQQEPIEFDLEGLSTVGSLKQTRTVQGQSFCFRTGLRV
jgi:hypothetical protein